jgi:putative Holliday junction resolvase
MPICNPSDLPGMLPRRARLMGFDVGAKTIGLAVSDPALTLASPIETIRRSRWAQDAERIRALASYWAVGGFVVGIAFNMDGSEGPSAQRCRAFARSLLEIADLPLVLQDERLSSHAAAEAMREAGARRGRREANIDSVAASVILQDLLDGLARPRLEDGGHGG